MSTYTLLADGIFFYIHYVTHLFNSTFCTCVCGSYFMAKKNKN